MPIVFDLKKRDNILYIQVKKGIYTFKKGVLKYLNPLLEGDRGRATLISIRWGQSELKKDPLYNHLLAIRRISIQAFI